MERRGVRDPIEEEEMDIDAIDAMLRDELVHQMEEKGKDVKHSDSERSPTSSRTIEEQHLVPLSTAAVAAAAHPTDRQQFEAALLRLQAERLRHCRAAAGEVHCVVLSASALTRAVITQQMRHLSATEGASWASVGDCSRAEEAEGLLERRLLHCLRRHPDPLVRRRAEEPRKTLQKQKKEKEGEKGGGGGGGGASSSSTNEGGSHPTAGNSGNGNGSSDNSSSSRPLPSGGLVALVIVDAYLHEHYTEAASALRRLERDYGGTLAAVLLADPRGSAAAAGAAASSQHHQGQAVLPSNSAGVSATDVSDETRGRGGGGGGHAGLGLQLLPEATVTPSEGYVAGYDLVLPCPFDHSAALFLAEVFLSAAGRWRQRWAASTAAAAAGAHANAAKGRGSIEDDEDDAFEGEGAGNNRGGRAGAGRGAIVANYHAIRHLLGDAAALALPTQQRQETVKGSHRRNEGNQQQSAHHRSTAASTLAAILGGGGRGSGDDDNDNTASSKRRKKKQQLALLSPPHQTKTTSAPGDCIDTNPDYVRLLARYEHCLIATQRLQKELKEAAEARDAVAAARAALEGDNAALKRRLAAATAGRKRRGLSSKNSNNNDGSLIASSEAGGDEDWLADTIDPIADATLEEMLELLGLETAEDVARELAKARHNRITDAGQISTLSQQVAKLRARIAESSAELERLEAAKKANTLQIRDLSEALEDIRDDASGVLGKRAQLEALVKAQREDLELLAGFLIDLREVFGTVLPDRFRRRFGRFVEAEVGELVLNHYRREHAKDETSMAMAVTAGNGVETLGASPAAAAATILSATATPAAASTFARRNGGGGVSSAAPLLVLSSPPPSTIDGPPSTAAASASPSALPLILTPPSPASSSNVVLSPTTAAANGNKSNNNSSPFASPSTAKDPLSGMILEDISLLLSGAMQRGAAAEAAFRRPYSPLYNASPSQQQQQSGAPQRVSTSVRRPLPPGAAGNSSNSYNSNAAVGAFDGLSSPHSLSAAATPYFSPLPTVVPSAAATPAAAANFSVSHTAAAPLNSLATNNSTAALPTTTLSPDFLLRMAHLRRRRLSQAGLMRQLQQDKEISDLRRAVRQLLGTSEALEAAAMAYHDSNQDFSSSPSRRGTMLAWGAGGGRTNSQSEAADRELMEQINAALAAGRGPRIGGGGDGSTMTALYSNGRKADKATSTADDNGAAQRRHHLTDAEIIALWRHIEGGGGVEEGVFGTDNASNIIRIAAEVAAAADGSGAIGNNNATPNSNSNKVGKADVSVSVAIIDTSTSAAATVEAREQTLEKISDFLARFRGEEEAAATALTPHQPSVEPPAADAPRGRRRGDGALSPLQLRDMARFVPQGTAFNGLTPHALPAAVSSPYFKMRK